MFTVQSEYVMDFCDVEKFLRQHATEMLENIDPHNIDFVRLGNPTDVSWDPAAIGYRVLRNNAAHNVVDFWLVRTRDGRALLAMTTEGSRYSTTAAAFNETASEFEAARERIADELQQSGTSEKMLVLGQQLLAIDYPALYNAALRRTFRDGAIPAQWQQMPQVSPCI